MGLLVEAVVDVAFVTAIFPVSFSVRGELFPTGNAGEVVQGLGGTIHQIYVGVPPLLTACF